MDGLFAFALDETSLGGGYEAYKRLPDPLCRFLDRLAGHHRKWAINTTQALDDQWKLVCESPVSSRLPCLISEFGRRMATPNRQGGIDPVADYEADYADLLERVCREKNQAASGVGDARSAGD